MQLEQETLSMLIGGFSLVLGIAVVLVIRWWIIRKKSAYGWVLAHLISLACAIALWLTMIPTHTGIMASEDNSLRLGEAGLVWAVSMVFLLVGVGKKK